MECEFPQDDRCRNQDRIVHCDPATLESTEYDCNTLCGDNLNLSCVATGTGAHGCWCVTPGDTQRLTCGDLEVCLRACATATDDTCNDACTAQTDAPTIRMYGVLLSCAHRQCHEACIASADDCNACIASSLTGSGDCGLARAVCDTHELDDPLSIWE